MPLHRKLIAVMWAMMGLMVIGLGLFAWLGTPERSAASVGTNHSLLAELFPWAVHKKLPALFDAPKFQLTDETGKPFGSAQLHGKVWVADFIFTRCQGLRPMMTRHMHDLQTQTASTPLQLVSVSVDPTYDTPAVLTQYAHKNHADLSRWHFLTGSKMATWNLSKGLKVAVEPDPGGQVFHSDRFLLVDGYGQVRGDFDSTDAGYKKKLIAAAKTLIRGQAEH